jgi:hypothetical protein
MRSFFAILALAAAPSIVTAIWDAALTQDMNFCRLDQTDFQVVYDYPLPIDDPDLPDLPTAKMDLKDCIGVAEDGNLVVCYLESIEDKEANSTLGKVCARRSLSQGPLLTSDCYLGAGTMRTRVLFVVLPTTQSLHVHVKTTREMKP